MMEEKLYQGTSLCDLVLYGYLLTVGFELRASVYFNHIHTVGINLDVQICVI
jgi:hypothetical protein